MPPVRDAKKTLQESSARARQARLDKLAGEHIKPACTAAVMGDDDLDVIPTCSLVTRVMLRLYALRTMCSHALPTCM